LKTSIGPIAVDENVSSRNKTVTSIMVRSSSFRMA
jgi:hypothetical protein